MQLNRLPLICWDKNNFMEELNASKYGVQEWMK
jgi:hypothetical protein